MNRLFFILLLVLVSCQTEYKSFYNLHKLNPKTFETESKNQDKNLIHIYSFDNNIMNKKINGFRSLTYNTLTNEKVYIDTEEKNRKKYIASKTAPKYFKEFDFIIENYLNGNIEYLISLQNSFSSAEVGSYFYIFDFRTHKVLKVNAIAFDFKRKTNSMKNTAANIVFAKGGVEYIIEKPDAFSRNLLFILLFFVIW